LHHHLHLKTGLITYRSCNVRHQGAAMCTHGIMDCTHALHHSTCSTACLQVS
jgi:hypothetical protein